MMTMMTILQQLTTPLFNVRMNDDSEQELVKEKPFRSSYSGTDQSLHNDQRRVRSNSDSEAARRRQKLSSGYGTGSSKESADIEDEVFSPDGGPSRRVSACKPIVEEQTASDSHAEADAEQSQEPRIQEGHSCYSQEMSSSYEITPPESSDDADDDKVTARTSRKPANIENDVCPHAVGLSNEMSVCEPVVEEQTASGASAEDSNFFAPGSHADEADAEQSQKPWIPEGHSCSSEERSSSYEITPPESSDDTGHDKGDAAAAQHNPALPDFSQLLEMNEATHSLHYSNVQRLLEDWMMQFIVTEQEYRVQRGDSVSDILRDTEQMLVDFFPCGTINTGAIENGEAADAVSVSQVGNSRILETVVSADMDSRELARCLRMAACCTDLCNSKLCNLGKELWEGFKNHLEWRGTQMSDLDAQIIRGLKEHAAQCEEQRCPVPWCTFMLELDNLDSDLDLFHVFRARLSLNEPLFDPADDSMKCEMLQSSADPGVEMHRENIDWKFCCSIGDFDSQVSLVRKVRGGQHLVIKKMKASGRNVPLMCEALEKLRGQRHESVATVLWYLCQKKVDRLFLCSVFAGRSLQEYLRMACPAGLGWDKLKTFMCQLLDGMDFLHSHKVLYLGWESSNIVVGLDETQLKLCNFAYALPVTEMGPYAPGDEEMMEDLTNLLQPGILAPEISRLLMVYTPASDLWGLGCIMLEMATCLKVHSDVCHEELSRQRELIKRNPVPECFSAPGPVKLLVRMCCRIDPEERPPVKEVKRLLYCKSGPRQ